MAFLSFRIIYQENGNICYILDRQKYTPVCTLNYRECSHMHMHLTLHHKYSPLYLNFHVLTIMKPHSMDYLLLFSETSWQFLCFCFLKFSPSKIYIVFSGLGGSKHTLLNPQWTQVEREEGISYTISHPFLSFYSAGGAQCPLTSQRGSSGFSDLHLET